MADGHGIDSGVAAFLSLKSMKEFLASCFDSDRVVRKVNGDVGLLPISQTETALP